MYMLWHWYYHQKSADKHIKEVIFMKVFWICLMIIIAVLIIIFLIRGYHLYQRKKRRKAKNDFEGMYLLNEKKHKVN